MSLLNVFGLACLAAVVLIVLHGLAQHNYVGVTLYVTGFIGAACSIWRNG